MNVHRLQYSSGLSEAPMVLSVMPLVWCKTYPDVGDPGYRGHPMQGSQASRTGEVGCPWPCRDADTKSCPWSSTFVPTGLRAPEQDETPLSQSEATLATRFFPIAVSP